MFTLERGCASLQGTKVTCEGSGKPAHLTRAFTVQLGVHVCDAKKLGVHKHWLCKSNIVLNFQTPKILL